MALKAMEAICLAEENANKQKAEALAKAKNSVTQAEEEGKAALAALTERVAAELREIKADLLAKAENQARAISEQAEKEKEELVQKAESRLDAAADLIVERIVNG